MKTAVLLPTYDEAKSIKEMIERVRKADNSYSIYVVDSGSEDGTVEIAEKNGAKLIKLTERGKGLAIKKAFAELEEDFVVMLDADLTYAPEEIGELLNSLKDCDVVVGSRFSGEIEDGAMKPINKFGNRMLTLIAKALYWKRISDVCSGFWAFRKKAYKKMVIDARHFSLEANFYAECARLGLKLCEVPISYGARQGESKLTVMHGLEIGCYLAKRRFIRP